MVLEDFEVVVQACRKRGFNVRSLVDRLLAMNSVFGGPGGCLQQVTQTASNDAAANRFCDEWILLRNNESIVNVVMAAKQCGDNDFAAFILEEVEKVIKTLGGDIGAKHKMSKRLHELGQSSKPGQTQEFRFVTAGVPIFSYYYPRPTLEAEIIEKVKDVAKEPKKGALILWGLGGIGKTSLMAHILEDKTYRQQLVDSDVHSAIWINCFRWRDTGTFNETDFLTELSGIARKISSIPGGCCDLEEIVAFFGTCRPIFILDDMFNIELLTFFRRSCPSAVCCVLTRELTIFEMSAPSYQGIQLRCGSVLVKEWSDKDVKGALDLLVKGLTTKQVDELCKRCYQLPLIVNMIGAHFSDTKWSAGMLNFKYNQILKKLGNISEQPLEESQYKTVGKLFQFSFERLSSEDEQLYYAFLLFDPAEPVQVTDLATLWGFSEESDIVLEKLYGSFLTSSLLREETDSSGATLFSVHQLLHDVARDYAINKEVAKDLDHLRFRIVTGFKTEPCLDVMLGFLSKNNRSLLRRIMSKLKGEYLAEICRWKEEKTEEKTFLHYLYNHRWPDDVKSGRFFHKKAHSESLVLEILQKIRNECASSYFEKISKIIADPSSGQGLLFQNENETMYYSIDRKFLTDFLKPWIRKLSQEEWRNEMLEKHNGNVIIKAALQNQLLVDMDLLKTQKLEKDEIELLLEIAVELSNYTIIEKLFPFMSDDLQGTLVNVVKLPENNTQRTPLSRAAEYGHLEVVKFLFDKFPDAVKLPDKWQRTPIFWAAENGHLEVVNFLFDKFPDAVKLLDKHQRTTLSLAAENGHNEVVKFLFNKFPGAMKSPDKYERTPLSFAVVNGHLEMVKFLTSNSQTALNLSDETPRESLLSFAAMSGHLEVIKYLYDKFPDAVKLPDEYEQTPLSRAAEYGHLEVVKFLFDKFPDAVKFPNTSQETPLSLAAGSGHLEVTKFLFDKYPDAVKLFDEHKRTPLSLAAGNGHLEVVKFLFDKFPDAVKWLDNKQQTPLSYAIGYGHQELVEFLSSCFC